MCITNISSFSIQMSKQLQEKLVDLWSLVKLVAGKINWRYYKACFESKLSICRVKHKYFWNWPRFWNFWKHKDFMKSVKPKFLNMKSFPTLWNTANNRSDYEYLTVDTVSMILMDRQYITFLLFHTPKCLNKKSLKA